MNNAFLCKQGFINEPDTNYECFGWWLPDLRRRLKISEPNGKKTGGCGNGIFLTGSHLVREESLTLNSELDRTDVYESISGFEGKTTVNEKCIKGECVTNNIRNITPVSPLTIARSDIQYLRSKATLKSKKIYEGSALSKQQLATLINSDSPNHTQLESVLSLGYQTPTESAKSRRQFETSRLSNKSSGTAYITGGLRTRLQEVGATSRVDVDRKGLSPFVESAVSSVEHDTDQELEEPRGQFLRTVSGLDSKLKALHAGAMQLHSHVNTLHRDFQVSLTVQFFKRGR
jgi:hypothetical protein